VYPLCMGISGLLAFVLSETYQNVSHTLVISFTGSILPMHRLMLLFFSHSTKILAIDFFLRGLRICGYHGWR
jgi:hypothetical protein